MTQTYLTAEELSLCTKYDVGFVPSRFGDSVPAGISYLHTPANQVREDKPVYIPDHLSNDQPEDPDAWPAAQHHAKHLLKAEGHINDALNLADVMLASLAYEYDSRSTQMDTGLRTIRKKMNKVRRRIDKHDRRHLNLFLAYAALCGKTDQGNKD